jgi:hypothetical protein
MSIEALLLGTRVTKEDTLTGHGLKDSDTAAESATRPTMVPPDRRTVRAQLGF